MNYHDTKKMITIDKRIRRRSLLIIFCVIFCVIAVLFFMNFVYRPYIYANKIDDFHLANSYSNLFSVTLYIHLMLAFSKQLKYNPIIYILVACLGFVMFEFFFGLTFDYYDIIATCLSGVITFLSLKLIGVR